MVTLYMDLIIAKVSYGLVTITTYVMVIYSWRPISVFQNLENSTRFTDMYQR